MMAAILSLLWRNVAGITELTRLFNREGFLWSILRTVFETEAETLIIPLAFDLTEKAETRILPLVIKNSPDYCYGVSRLKLVNKHYHKDF